MKSNTVMKKILVGVDFSRTSILAFRYALNIARYTQSEILVINVQKQLDYDIPIGSDEKKAPREVEEQCKSLIEEYRPQVNFEIDYVVREGSVQKEISNQAKYSNAWLIVVGAHGLSGFQESWMGTDSYRIVSTAEKPVITVRKDFNIERKLSNIVLPIDSTMETVQKIGLTIEIAIAFQATIHVVSLYSTMVAESRERVDQYASEAIQQVNKAGLDLITVTLKADNITDATIEYATGIDADLISIMTEQEFAPRNIWLGPYAQQMVNHSPVPVLSIPSKKLVRGPIEVEG
jgi:nucleotide-binding universal stress UspA family protein